jgi:hypothetical protein
MSPAPIDVARVAGWDDWRTHELAHTEYGDQKLRQWVVPFLSFKS